MLGGIKGDPGFEDIPLFRLLARRWKPVVPLRREGAILLSTRKGERSERRVWTSKSARSIYANGTFEQKISKRAWNPWLWMK